MIWATFEALWPVLLFGFALVGILCAADWRDTNRAKRDPDWRDDEYPESVRYQR